MPKQKLNNYDGSITGNEITDGKYTCYDPQSYNSPGGTNNIKTRWTEGHGGKGDITTSTHVHNSDKYTATNYGNMYKKNSDTIIQQTEFIDDEISDNLSLILELENQSGVESFQTTKLKDDFYDQQIDNASLIETKSNLNNSIDSRSKGSLIKKFLIAIVLLIWGCFLCVFIEQVIHKNVKLRWTTYLIYAIFTTIGAHLIILTL